MAGSGHFYDGPSREVASGTPGQPPHRDLAPRCLPRGKINHGVNYWFSVHICLLFSTLLSYRNSLGIDRLILIHFNLTPPIDNVFVKRILNNHK